MTSRGGGVDNMVAVGVEVVVRDGGVGKAACGSRLGAGSPR